MHGGSVRGAQTEVERWASSLLHQRLSMRVYTNSYVGLVRAGNARVSPLCSSGMDARVRQYQAADATKHGHAQSMRKVGRNSGATIKIQV